MTISSTAASVVGKGNGATTAFTYSFLIPTSSDVQVTYVDAAGNATQLNSSQYSISGIGSDAGGTVTYPLSGSPIASGTSITVSRVLSMTQPTVLRNQGGYFPQTVESALDRIVMLIQQVSAGLGAARALLFPTSDVNPTTTLPVAAARANKYLAFDLNGNPVALSGTSSSPDLSANTVVAAASATARSLAARFADVLNVKDFGAKGDGVTDDSTAIQNAVNVASQAGGSNILCFQKGLYLCNSVISVPFSKVNFVGAGIENTQWKFGTSAYLSAAGVMSYTRISDMTLMGSYGGGSQLLNFANPFACIFERVFFTRAATLVTLGSAEGFTHFRDCYFYDAGTAGGAFDGTGIVLSNSAEIIFDNCPFEFMTYGVTWTITNAVAHMRFSNIHTENIYKFLTVTNNGLKYNGRVTVRDSFIRLLGNAASAYFYYSTGIEARFDNVLVMPSTSDTPVLSLLRYDAVTVNYQEKDMPDATTLFARVDGLNIDYGNVPRAIAAFPYFVSNATGDFATTGVVAKVFSAPDDCQFSVTAGQAGSQQARVAPSWPNQAVPFGKVVVVAFDYKFDSGTLDVTFNMPCYGGNILGCSYSTLKSVGDTAFTLDCTQTAGYVTAYIAVQYANTGDAPYISSGGFFYAPMPTSAGVTVATQFHIRNFRILGVDRLPIGVVDMQTS